MEPGRRDVDLHVSTMPLDSTFRSLVLALAVPTGCGGVGDGIADLLDRVRANADDAVVDEGGETSAVEDRPATDDVTGAHDDAPGEVVAAAAVAPTSTVTTPPDDLEVRDVEVEWIDRGSWGHYGAHEKLQVLRVHATGKLRATVGRDSNVTVKAVCSAEPAPLADADVASIRGGYLDPPPSAPEEFPIAVDLFQTMQPKDPSLCRLQFLLVDTKATPPRRGSFEACWRRGSKVAAPCTEEDVLPTHAEPRDGWAIERAEFAASGELLFTVVGGRSRAPDRIALRTTCYVGDKRFVDFDFLVGRWYALAPGDGIRQRMYMSDLADMLRFAECDLAFQDAGYDFEKFALRGTKDMAHLCVRPTGLARGACRVEASESATWDPTTAPAKLDMTHSGAHAYRGYLSAYMNAELTVLAGLPKDAKMEAVVRCGKREARQAVTSPLGLELVWPGQTVRVWAGASMAAKTTKGCKLETTLATTDRDGKPTTWSLSRTCFDKLGNGVPCPT
jgi:hypothetical protein